MVADVAFLLHNIPTQKTFDNIYIEVFKPVPCIFGLEKSTESGKMGEYQAIPP